MPNIFYLYFLSYRIVIVQNVDIINLFINPRALLLFISPIKIPAVFFCYRRTLIVNKMTTSLNGQLTSSLCVSI